MRVEGHACGVPALLAGGMCYEWVTPGCCRRRRFPAVLVLFDCLQSPLRVLVPLFSCPRAADQSQMLLRDPVRACQAVGGPNEAIATLGTLVDDPEFAGTRLGLSDGMKKSRWWATGGRQEKVAQWPAARWSS